MIACPHNTKYMVNSFSMSMYNIRCWGIRNRGIGHTEITEGTEIVFLQRRDTGGTQRGLGHTEITESTEIVFWQRRDTDGHGGASRLHDYSLSLTISEFDFVTLNKVLRLKVEEAQNAISSILVLKTRRIWSQDKLWTYLL